MVAGVVRRDGVYVRCGGRLHRLPRTTQTVAAFVATVELTPLGRDVQAMCDGILRGNVESCPVCERFGCDCGEWHECMNADPHGDLSDSQSMEIPY